VQKEDLMGNAWAARSYVRAFVGIKAKHFALHFVHASCTAGRIQTISSSPRAALPACRLLTFNRRLKFEGGWPDGGRAWLPRQLAPIP
jgi:hypothetical protein